MKIKIKKLQDIAVTPSYAKPGDAGMDLTAVSKTVVNEEGYGYIEYGTGIAVEIPEGFVGFILPRSSISKTGMILANSVATIDSGYRGELLCRFKHVPNSVEYNLGDKVAQLVVLPYPIVEFEEVQELTQTVRQAGAFGSTGK